MIRRAAVLLIVAATSVLVSISPSRPARAAEGFQLDFGPANSTSIVGKLFGAVATLTLNGQPMPNQPVTFLVRNEKGALIRAADDNTDANGRAELQPYSSQEVRTDFITASAYLKTDPPFTLYSPTIQHEWINPTLAVYATPSGTSGRTGSTFTIQASVTADEGPADLARVTMESTMPGDAAVTQTKTADRFGQVAFSYTRKVAGDDSIIVTAGWEGLTASTTLSRTWTSDPPTSDPPTSDPPTSDPPTSDPPVTDPPTTDPPSSDPPTSDPPTSGPPTSGPPTSPTQSPTTTPVTPTPLNPVITLDPDNLTSRTGTTFTATARLTSSSGDPIPARLITFVTTMKAQRQLTHKAATDQEGTARFSYRRADVGSDVVLASVTVDGLTVSDRIDHRWSRSSPPPSEGTLTLGARSASPGGDLALEGGGCPPGARVRITIGERSVASTLADPAGGYSIVAALPDLPLGRHRIRAACGNATAQADVDVIGLTASTGTAGPAAAMTSAAVLTFFVLLGGSLVRRTSGRHSKAQ